MRNTPFFTLALLVATTTLFAQQPQLPASVTATVKATGQTTGHIADAVLTNKGKRPETVTIPAATIPSDGKRQGYAVPEPEQITVPGNATVTVPVHGYCTEMDLPAASPGSVLPPFSGWDANSPLLATVRDIVRSTTVLQEGGKIKTPFTGEPEKERDAVVQQTIWVLPRKNDPDAKDDFCDRTKRQFENATGKPVSALPPAEQAALQRGIAEIWEAVKKVGSSAGIFTVPPPELPPAAAALPDAPPSQFPALTNMIRVEGTGNTTGIIANISVGNPTAEPIQVRFGPNTSPAGTAPGTSAYIPSDGRYQPYIVPYLPHVTVPSGQTVIVPVQGFCTDVRKSPVPAGNEMPPLSAWVTPAPPFQGIESSGLPGTTLVVVVPTRPAPTLATAVRLLTTLPGAKPAVASSTDCPDGLYAPMPLVPGTDKPVPVPINPETHPAVGVPLLLDAIQRIAQTYDELKGRGVVTTPFGNNPGKEREAVIQQTFWKYTAALRGEPYEKQDFKANTVRQFEQNTGKTYAQLPEQQQEKMDKGVDDFWDSFEAVGAEAKILPRTPEPPKPVPSVDEFFQQNLPGGLKPKGTTTAPVPANPRQTVADPLDSSDPPVPVQARRPEKACTCGDISFFLFVWDTEAVPPPPPGGVRGIGNPFRDTLAAGSKAGLPDEEIKAGKSGLANGSSQIVELKDIKADCPCVTITDAIKDAAKALAKLEKDNGGKLAKAKTDLADKEARLKKEQEKKRPSQATIDRLTGEIAELKAKISELEGPIKAKETEIDDLKKAAKDSDCPVYNNDQKTATLPTIKVLVGGQEVNSTWYDDPAKPAAKNLKFTLKKVEGTVMECRIEVTFYCQSDDCKAVSCSRVFVLKVDG
ncbi:MAG: hypothetical protein ACKVU2_06515 [Saprospiraceae bacterium]